MNRIHQPNQLASVSSRVPAPLPLPPLVFSTSNNPLPCDPISHVLAAPFKHLSCLPLATFAFSFTFVGLCLCLFCFSCHVPCHHHLCLSDQPCHFWGTLPTDLAIHKCGTHLAAETASVHRVGIRSRRSCLKERFDFRTNSGVIWQTSEGKVNVFKAHFSWDSGTYIVRNSFSRSGLTRSGTFLPLISVSRQFMHFHCSRD